MTAVFALASLKAAGLAVNFSSASAAGEVGGAPIMLTPPVKSGPGETEQRMLEQLEARTREIEAREVELETRESVLAAAELRVEAAMKAVQEEKASLAIADEGRARDRSDEIGALANAYERMKPREAARIFEALDDDILIPIAAGMRTQSLAGVLAEMAPARASALTVALADRGAAPAAAAPSGEALQPIAASVEP
jgi:flagellar motility protein MotE (MotC chaperone)